MKEDFLNFVRNHYCADEDDWKAEFLSIISDSYDYQYLVHVFAHHGRELEDLIHMLASNPMTGGHIDMLHYCKFMGDSLYRSALMNMVKLINNLLNTFVVERYHDQTTHFDPANDWVSMLAADAQTLSRKAEADLIGMHVDNPKNEGRRMRI